ncbi:uncharacterized protein LOC144745825 [Ciona intestinalis]
MIIQDLEKKVADLLDEKSLYVSVTENDYNDINDCFNEGKLLIDLLLHFSYYCWLFSVQSQRKVDDFHQLFWSEQKKLNSRENKGYRFHPELMRYALLLYSHSRRSYCLLKDSGILKLPSEKEP